MNIIGILAGLALAGWLLGCFVQGWRFASGRNRRGHRLGRWLRDSGSVRRMRR